MTIAALILAGGNGARFGAAKQFERLDGERLIDRVVNVARDACDDITLVLPAGIAWDGPDVDRLVVGGATHADSTRRGAVAIPAHDDLLIWGPSHPLAQGSLIHELRRVRAAHDADAAVPVRPIVDVVAAIDDGTFAIEPTKGTHTVQYPYVVRRSTFQRGLETADAFREELEVIEAAGGSVVTIEGPATNIHITTPADLTIAERLC